MGLGLGAWFGFRVLGLGLGLEFGVWVWGLGFGYWGGEGNSV